MRPSEIASALLALVVLPGCAALGPDSPSRLAARVPVAPARTYALSYPPPPPRPAYDAASGRPPYDPAPAPPPPAAVSSDVAMLVVSPVSGLRCRGSYDRLEKGRLQVPVDCSDGRDGYVLFSPSYLGDGGQGRVRLSDASSEFVTFGRSGPGEVTAVLDDDAFRRGSAYPAAEPVRTASVPPGTSTAPIPAAVPPSRSVVPDADDPAPSPAPVPDAYPLAAPSAGRTYSGNCPTPESLDAAGRRCGRRSAASRPGGYDGYGSWSSPSAYPSSPGSAGETYSGSRYGVGGTYVRSYHRRDGTFVRGHYRRR